MANIENIFRFISLRPTRLEKEKGRLNMHVYQPNSKSTFYNEIKKAVAAGATIQELSAIGRRYKKLFQLCEQNGRHKIPGGGNGCLDFREWKPEVY